MSFAAFVATIIIVLFLVTIVIAVGSYAAYKLRERRRPALTPTSSKPQEVGGYFERVDASAFER
jgi:hypothetical protein